jgi:hypothetical protein
MEYTFYHQMCLSESKCWYSTIAYIFQSVLVQISLFDNASIIYFITKTNYLNEEINRITRAFPFG